MYKCVFNLALKHGNLLIVPYRLWSQKFGHHKRDRWCSRRLALLLPGKRPGRLPLGFWNHK